MINIDVTEYAFVDESVAQSLCEVLKIESIQLIKKRLIRVYDERKNQIIIHVIYSKMIIQEYIKNLIFMLIIKLRQQTLILDKSWMRKHDVSYHEKTNIIEFYSEFCTHSRRIKTTNKEKNIHFEKKSFLNQLDYFKFDNSTKKSKKNFTIVIKVFSRKEHNSDQSAINLFRKDKKSIKSIDRIEDSKSIKDFRLNLNELKISNSKEKKSLLVINIAMIETSAFNMMNKRKNVSLFFVILKDVEKHLEKYNKSNIVIKNVLSVEYHEFLNVFDKKAFNTFVSHRFYDHKIVLKKKYCSRVYVFIQNVRRKIKDRQEISRR
jgi:thiol-disulfide isomerase/thioredoxin